MLIACRALMRIGGALRWPTTLGMTYSILPRERAALAGGLIIGAANFGNAAGPLIGGFAAAVTALDPSRASLAGGIVSMFQVAGGSVGLGIATTVFTARAGDGLSWSVGRVMRDSFESGFQAAFLLVAALALAGFVVTVLFVGRRTKAGASRAA